MLTTLYEEKSFILCEKPVGVLSQSDDNDRKTMPEIIATEKGLPIDSVFPVHRLDAEVGGVMVYAKSKPAAGKLSTLVAEHKMEKEYLAIVHGIPQKESDVLKDLLFKDSSKNKSFVVSKQRKGVKEASLEYTLLGSAKYDDGDISLVKIKLHTGRTHQIRVQFSSRQLPLLGDRRYGSGKDSCKTALWSYRLCFPHPFKKGELVCASALPDLDTSPWSCFDRSLYSALIK